MRHIVFYIRLNDFNNWGTVPTALLIAGKWLGLIVLALCLRDDIKAEHGMVTPCSETKK